MMRAFRAFMGGRYALCRRERAVDLRRRVVGRRPGEHAQLLAPVTSTQRPRRGGMAFRLNHQQAIHCRGRGCTRILAIGAAAHATTLGIGHRRNRRYRHLLPRPCAQSSLGPHTRSRVVRRASGDCPPPRRPYGLSRRRRARSTATSPTMARASPMAATITGGQSNAPSWQRSNCSPPPPPLTPWLFDYVTIGGTSYSGADGPSNVPMAARDTLYRGTRTSAHMPQGGRSAACQSCRHPLHNCCSRRHPPHHRYLPSPLWSPHRHRLRRLPRPSRRAMCEDAHHGQEPREAGG